MEIVIDASITLALFVHLPYSDQVESLFRGWRTQSLPLHAPVLWPAEVVSALRKMLSVEQISEEDARLAIANWSRLPVQVNVPDAILLDDSLVWAGRLGQIVTYDAQYLALAERLAAECWTADQKCRGMNLPMWTKSWQNALPNTPGPI